MISLHLPKIIAHRGASGYAPENTLIAMQEAHRLGARWVEFDVMLTQDKQAILMHDEMLDRTTDGAGWVADMTFEEMNQLDAGSWFDKKFVKQPIPTFVEILKFLKSHQMNMNIEIKPALGKEIETAEVVIELLNQHWPCQTISPLITSASETSLKTAYAINPDLPYGWIEHDWRENWEDHLKSLHCVSLSINHEHLNARRVQKIKEAGYFIIPYTVNTLHRAEELFEWGADAIFTDYPDLLVK